MTEDWRRDVALLQREARRLAHDEWETFARREAAKAAGAWLERKGGLGRPIASLVLADLEGIVDAAIQRWIVVNSHRLAEQPDSHEELGFLLAG